MWKNKFNKVYFFYKEYKFYDLHEKGSGTTNRDTKKHWAVNGLSILIGPDTLGSWHDYGN